MRNCIVILNLSNFTGSMNHAIKNNDGSYQKLRVDYAAMLTYLVGDRKLLGAYVVSQQDTAATNKTQEQILANQLFVKRLKKFGWDSISVSYNSVEADLNPVFDSIWKNSLSPFVNSDGSWSINPATTDVVFVNGSSSWFDILNAFFESGFQIEVAYPKTAVSKLLTTNFAFLDLTQFLLHSNAKVMERLTSKE